MTFAIVAILFIVAAVLMFRNSSNMSGFEAAYRFDGQFHGDRHECIVRLSNMENGVRCMIGADTSGLYLFNPPARANARPGFMRGRTLFEHDIRIPWRDIESRTGSVFFRSRMWFHIARKNIHFHVPLNVGENLLAEAKRDPRA